MPGRRGVAVLLAVATFASPAAMGSAPAAALSAGRPRSGAASRPPSGQVGQPPSGSADAIQGGAQLAGTGVVVNDISSATPRLPKVPASAWVVANAQTGQVLAARDAHGWFRPASTLKVLTAVSLIPVLNPDATTVASRRAADTEPSDAGLVAGRSYRIDNLFTALLTISANDAAVALAQATGSFSKGMALINAEAHKLQADDTVARQPNGLDAPGQHTSAYDEALIARYALTVPAFLHYDRTRVKRFEDKPRHWVTLVNQNLMLTSYRGDIGGKIGWTTAAGATYMGMAERNGTTLIVTLLHCRPLTEFTYASRLLNWGFAANGQVKPVGTLVSPLPAHTAAKPKPRVTKAAPRHPATAARPSSYGPAAVGVGFLLLASLVVTGFVIWYRRPAAASTRGSRRGSASLRD